MPDGAAHPDAGADLRTGAGADHGPDAGADLGPDAGADLRADCSRCAALCCVAPAFAASSDFAIDKPAGRPCPHLRADDRCGIHARLRARGFAGCAVFDCFGAGQKVTQLTFAGVHWRTTPGLAPRVFEVFGVMRGLHEMLWYLTEAVALATGPLRREASAALDETTRLAALAPEALVRVDLPAHRAAVNAVLVEVSARARSRAGRSAADRRGADLAGADLRAADLRGASLRGALLLGADLRGVDLTLADVTGADLRGALLAGADLSATLFLTQTQLEAATGDANTRLPARRERPAHWVSGHGAGGYGAEGRGSDRCGAGGVGSDGVGSDGVGSDGVGSDGGPAS